MKNFNSIFLSKLQGMLQINCIPMNALLLSSIIKEIIFREKKFILNRGLTNILGNFQYALYHNIQRLSHSMTIIMNV